MARRRLSQQQKRRIRQSQQQVDLDDPNHQQATVISHRGGLVEVESENLSENCLCNVRSNLDDIVAGDRVVYRQDGDSLAIVSIMPRTNLLRRQDGFGNIKSVAANISQLIICLAVEPEPNLFLLDQYLLSAAQQGIDAIILLNKVDLVDTTNDPFQLRTIYTPLDYAVLHTSVKKSSGIERLREICVGHVNVFSGVSGVGKSSLTMALLPDIDIRIGEISEASREGRHTTRTSRLYHLPDGGDLIDTPGVRGFNPVIDADQPIAAGFREIERLSHDCKFANCRHLSEPGCAVRSASEQGAIAPSRYNHYLKMMGKAD